MNTRRGLIRVWLVACCVWLPAVAIWGYWHRGTSYDQYRQNFAAGDLESIFRAERGTSLYSAIGACTKKCQTNKAQKNPPERDDGVCPGHVPQPPFFETPRCPTCATECENWTKVFLVEGHPWRVVGNYIVRIIGNVGPIWALYGVLPMIALFLLFTVGLHPLRWIARGFRENK